MGMRPKVTEASNSADDDNAEGVEGSRPLEEFDIPSPVLAKLKDCGVVQLFPVQAKTFEHSMSGKDLIVQSRTGTGKTLAFALPIVIQLLSNKANGRKSKTAPKAGRAPRVLTLAPTRELAKQIADDFQRLLPNDSGLSVLPVYGGVPYEKHERALAKGVDVLVGAPGRVKDLLDQGKLKLARVKQVVLDEVDRMLDLGFRDAVEELLASVYYKERQKPPQTLLYSATLPSWVEETAGRYLNSENLVRLDLVTGDGFGRAASTVQHLAILSPYQSRSTAIADVIRVRGGGSTGRCIVFCERKRDADELAAHAAMSGHCHVLHGDIPQEKRELVLQKFREGKYRVLVTTDVAARGIDIPHVDLVIQCHPPKDTEAYIHRAGRTGRAGRSGVAVTFYTVKEEPELKRVERIAGIKFKRIGAPTAADLVQSTARDSLQDLYTVSDKTVSLLTDSASEIIAEMGAERAVAAALALLSGKTDIVSRSLLSAREGYTAYVLHTTADTVRGKGYLYGALRRCLDPDQVEKVQYVTFSKDRRSLLFDLPSDMETIVDEKWQDGRWDSLEKLEELPELEQVDREAPPRYSNHNCNRSFNGNNRSFNGNNRSFNGNNRSFNGNNRSFNGSGAKRKFFNGNSGGGGGGFKKAKTAS